MASKKADMMKYANALLNEEGDYVVQYGVPKVTIDDNGKEVVKCTLYQEIVNWSASQIMTFNLVMEGKGYWRYDGKDPATGEDKFTKVEANNDRAAYWMERLHGKPTQVIETVEQPIEPSDLAKEKLAALERLN